MSYIKIMVHVVWRTYNNTNTLDRETRSILFDHIQDYARSRRIYVIAIGGYVDHVHCLVSLSHDQSIAKVVQYIKGESSHWANKQGIFPGRLVWGEEYYAGSVSHSVVPTVIRYIANQEEHHRQLTWSEEVEQLRVEYGLRLD